MDPLLTDTYHDVIDDTLTFSSVISIFLTAGLPKKVLVEVCALLLKGDESWEAWLSNNAPKALLKQLSENPLNLIPPPEVSYDDDDYKESAMTSFVNHIRVMALSVACDLAIFPFWALKVNHIAGVYRTTELKECVSRNLALNNFVSTNLSSQIFSMFGAPTSISAAASAFLRGSVAICTLGLLRNYSSILAREDEASVDNDATFSYNLADTGGLEVGNKDSKNRIKSMGLMHDGQHSQKSTGRPSATGKKHTRKMERRASGNIFYESKDDLEMTDSERAKLSFRSSKRPEAPQISVVGRALISILLHPLELIAVRQVTSSSPAYATIFKSVSTIYHEVPGGSFVPFFQGWRSTLASAVFIPKGGWFMMGIPYLIRVRRMIPAAASAQGEGSPPVRASIADSLGVERMGQSLEILRDILSPGGGGVGALLSGAEVTARALLPSFLCLFAARVAVHAVFGRSERARVRRVRRDAFVRLYFEKAKMTDQDKAKAVGLGQKPGVRSDGGK